MQLTFRQLPIWILLACLVALPAATSLGQARDANASGWLGVMVGGSRDAGGEALEGVHLTRIIADGPAARAKLRARDRVLAVDGEPVSSSGQLVRRIIDDRDLTPFQHACREFAARAESYRIEMESLAQAGPDDGQEEWAQAMQRVAVQGARQVVENAIRG